MSILINLSILFFMMLIFQKVVRNPYFNPKVRWWETAERFWFNAHINNGSLLGIDISETGIYVCTEKKNPYHINQKIELHITYEELPAIHLLGTIVRIADESDHKKGLGIQFQTPVNPEKAHLKKLLKRLKSEKKQKRYHFKF